MKLQSRTEMEKNSGGFGGWRKRGKDGFYDADTDLHEIRLCFSFSSLFFFFSLPQGHLERCETMRLGSGYAT